MSINDLDNKASQSDVNNINTVIGKGTQVVRIAGFAGFNSSGNSVSLISGYVPISNDIAAVAQGATHNLSLMSINDGSSINVSNPVVGILNQNNKKYLYVSATASGTPKARTYYIDIIATVTLS